MRSFHQAFSGRSRALLISCHIETNTELAVDNVQRANDAGADGAILINHGPTWRAVVDACRRTRKLTLRREFFIGVNFLDLDALEALNRLPSDAMGLWFDDSQIDEDVDDGSASAYLQQVRQRQLHECPNVLLMPSVAMKGVPYRDHERVARLARPWSDVVITSGTRTGSAPDLEKLRSMSATIKPHPLGNASGTSIYNVDDQKAAGVKLFITWTSLANPDGSLNTVGTHQLADAIHS